MSKSDDLISRQAAIDAIKTWGLIDGLAEGQAIEILADEEKLPSAQFEIIRCKDCKWYGRADKRRFYRGMDCLQKRIDTIVPDKDFCSKAERREE